MSEQGNMMDANSSAGEGTVQTNSDYQIDNAEEYKLFVGQV